MSPILNRHLTSHHLTSQRERPHITVTLPQITDTLFSARTMPTLTIYTSTSTAQTIPGAHAMPTIACAAADGMCRVHSVRESRLGKQDEILCAAANRIRGECAAHTAYVLTEDACSASTRCCASTSCNVMCVCCMLCLNAMLCLNIV